MAKRSILYPLKLVKLMLCNNRYNKETVVNNQINKSPYRSINSIISFWCSEINLIIIILKGEFSKWQREHFNRMYLKGLIRLCTRCVKKEKLDGPCQLCMFSYEQLVQMRLQRSQRISVRTWHSRAGWCVGHKKEILM